ncbi:MAG: 1-deoxy-D-xylulose-5-phosphate synthase [Acidobacteriota bacterium]|nr:1-deoxy-D-xylulose-5-phosphate synthase [Acidobacteriota bacterium]MDE3043459.1 1-deoxy-D-xylulose-5-phosphate synthase [Acidobacteriota bacterium]MDE3107264.1 1-deoxy-D-xylulose-5-phosphate synthase [Acidobacteriota bacterium]MDE3223634.1 1-deoxy-D-xylulose-5-phosphate synthase [Acidobacteriota bacterium]
MILPSIETPADLLALSYDELEQLSQEIRDFIIETVTTTGGHLGSNLGVVELTLALHRVFESPKDIILWDTGHQAYVHKLLTGRRYGFKHLRQRGGLSGYPNRSESQHDWIESSHASTALSYAHGLSVALEQRHELIGRGGKRHVVAVVGDGSLTGGMAYEALNNLGHSNQRVVIVLNDNGRSYAPTISKLSESLTALRLNRTYLTLRERLRRLVPHLPRVGKAAYLGIDGFTSVVREMVTPHTFFENLGVRYVGPIDGHDLAALETVLTNAATWDGPIVVHVLTQKGRGYEPAISDNLKMHDYKLPPRLNDEEVAPTSFTQAFSDALVSIASVDERVVALTAAMAGPTGLLTFQERYPKRFFDVGIAEQHAVTAAAGMAMGGLKPVVAVYATFFSRAFDQAHLDVGLLDLPVVFVFDRAGITGDDGPSHHGLLDMALALAIPNMTVFAPSTAEELPVMLASALALSSPSAIRFPKTPPKPFDGHAGEGLHARKIVTGDGALCVLAVGKMAPNAYRALELLGDDARHVTLYDVRVLPPDPAMIRDALAHARTMTIEDGTRHGGAGTLMVSAIRSLAQDLSQPVPSTRILGVPRAYLEHHRPDDLLAELGLDPEGLANAMRRLLRDQPEFAPPLPEAPRPRYL